MGTPRKKPEDPNKAAAAAATTTPATGSDWKEQVKTLGLNDEGVTALETQGVGSESDMALLSADEVIKYTGCGAIIAKKIEAAFKPAPEPVAEVAKIANPALTSAAAFDTILPTPLDDTSYMALIQTGGTLNVGKAEVISAVKAGIAAKYDLFDIPNKVMKAMEAFSEEQDLPVGDNFFEIQKLVTTRNYGEVLSVLGVPGSFVSEARKRKLFDRIDEYFWPALHEFRQGLKGWVETSNAAMANPGMAMAALAQALQGGVQMLQSADASVVRDLGLSVIDKINKVFSGTGIPVARALGMDAMRIRKVLEDPNIPAALGVTTKDMMLKGFNINVDAGDVRLERNLTRFALAIMELENVGPGNEEANYLTALYQLGEAIPWDRLPKTSNYKSRGGGRADDAGFPSNSGDTE